jgi:myo-inositol-1(or 4)-monophosphatase
MEKLLLDVIDLAVKAGEIVLCEGDEGAFEIGNKGTKENYVTSTDLKVQDYLKRELTALLPGSYFMGEEGDLPQMDSELVGSDRWVWIVDPIDGTANYARGMENSVVSIALMKRGTVVLGVVRHPYLDLTFWAQEGQGAFLNGKPIHVSDRTIEHAMLATAFSAYDKSRAPACFAIAQRLYNTCEDIRRTGTAAFELCMLAKGAVDIYFEINLSPWDYAAATRIVKEAGGCTTSLDGDVHLYGPGPVMAANTPENLEFVRKVVDDEVGEAYRKGTL